MMQCWLWEITVQYKNKSPNVVIVHVNTHRTRIPKEDIFTLHFYLRRVCHWVPQKPHRRCSFDCLVSNLFLHQNVSWNKKRMVTHSRSTDYVKPFPTVALRTQRPYDNMLLKIFHSQVRCNSSTKSLLRLCQLVNGRERQNNISEQLNDMTIRNATSKSI